MNAQQIQELIKGLNEASGTITELFFNPQENPELKKALGDLWESSMDYMTIYENLSRQQPQNSLQSHFLNSEYKNTQKHQNAPEIKFEALWRK